MLLSDQSRIVLSHCQWNWSEKEKIQNPCILKKKKKEKGIGAPSPQTKAITSVVTKAWPTPRHSIASQRGSTSRGSKARQWRASKRGVAKVADVLGEHGVGVDDHAGVSWMNISIQQGHQVLCKGRRHWGMEHLGQFRTKCFFSFAKSCQDCRCYFKKKKFFWRATDYYFAFPLNKPPGR